MTLYVPTLGVPLAGAAVAEATGDFIPFGNRILTQASDCFTAASMIAAVGSTPWINGTWFATSCPVAFPFVLNDSVTVYQLGWQNGSTVGGNTDCAIYDSSWNRKVSAGSTACSGVSTWQFVDVTDTVLGPGQYYAVLVHDSTTANHIQIFGQATGYPNAVLQLAGVQDSATTAIPLPDPLTNMALAATVANIPVIGIATRSLV